MSTKSKLVKTWLKTIRKALDELEEFFEQQDRSSEVELQLEYVMKKFGYLADRYHSILVKPFQYPQRIEFGCNCDPNELEYISTL